MPELVSNGPRIPVGLMNEVDDGAVVFFCGAGVSAGEASRLPNFAGLVDCVYEEHRYVPDAVERNALHLDVTDPLLRRPQLDKVLGLLEREDRIGADVVRRTVIKRLSEPPRGDLQVHEALISLSRVGRGGRLITTNFDNRFVDAGLDAQYIDAAPKLPVPKPHSWSGLVHLHGRIVAQDQEGKNLVLTAADFGRAYLTERWAARFVTELFREFAVVFVGYSVSDPVMGYLVDALAAERALGARFANAYAFAPHDGTLEGLEREQNGWLAKNVRAILYDKRDDHRLLADTLSAWAGIRDDPFHARSRIALNDISKLPTGPDDPLVERAVWALENPEAAKALAAAPPVVDEDDFPKLERWLDAFQEKGLLRCAAQDANSGAGDLGSAFVRLVDNGYQATDPHALDATRSSLARWIARHLHVPQVLSWILRSGGHMHPGLRSDVELQLVQSAVEIAPMLRYLWTVLLDAKPKHWQRFLWSLELHQRAISDAERERIEDAAVMAFAPRLVVHQGPSTYRRFAWQYDGRSQPLSPVEACGHLKLEIGDDESRTNVEGIVKCESVLARHAGRLTEYLEQALLLGQDDEDFFADSSFYRRSIAEHDQNRRHGTGVLGDLIALVRDAYFELARRERARAALLLHRWAQSGSPLFSRLSLHALTEDPKSDIQHARKLLVAGRRPGVWDRELRREALRFLRLAGARLPRTLRVEIVRTIRAGPKPALKNPSANEVNWVRGETKLRLKWLALSGAKLDKRSTELADGLKLPENGEDVERWEFDRWQGTGAQWIGIGDLAPEDLLDAPVSKVAQVLETGGLKENAFRGLVARKPVKVASALRTLAARRVWPAVYWQRFLWSLAGAHEQPEHIGRLQECALRILAKAPDALFAEIASGAADFVKSLGVRYGKERESGVGELWDRVWTAVGKNRPMTILRSNNLLGDALSDPAGILADVAIARLLKHAPMPGGGLPEEVRPYFDAIAVDPGGHPGRIILTTKLPLLFLVDPEWVEERLISLLEPKRSEEASNLWYAYAWSQVMRPDLLVALKEHFLEVLRTDEAKAQAEDMLTDLFMDICLDTPNELSKAEVLSVVDAMSEKALKVVLASLRSRLEGDSGQRATAWREKVHPWLRQFWPQPHGRNTPGTSNAMVDLLSASGDAFPDAVAWSEARLQHFEGHLFRLKDSGHPGQHPESTLSLLDKVVGPAGVPFQHRRTLRQIVDEMGGSAPALRVDPRFQRLYAIAIQ